MFDIGFLELLICGIIALLVLGPERLPGAARTAGRWVGRSRRLMRQFTSELDRQLKDDELREKLRNEGGIDLDGVQKNVRDGLQKARNYEHLLKDGESFGERNKASRDAPTETDAVPPPRPEEPSDETEPPMTPSPADREIAQSDPTQATPDNRT